MKKILIILIPILVAVAVFIIVLYLVNKNPAKGALQVTSVPKSKVYLDGIILGISPLCKCESKDMLGTGVHTVRLVPEEGNFEPFEEKITISPNVLTVIDRTFGLGATSQGSVINLVPIVDKKDAQLVVVSFPDNSLVFMDNSPAGMTPLLLKNVTESDHEIKITKEGYKDKIIRIRTVLGYKLESLVFLAVGELKASVSALPAVSLTPKISKILILQTPTGFLRVRETDSISSAEIAQVKPGEEYEIVSEKTDWFQIKLTTGKIGWVSSQYAKKEN